MVITLNQTPMLGSYQCPAEFFGNTPEVLAPIREDGEFDVVGTKRHRTEGKEVDVFGSQSCKKLIRSTWLILNSRIEVFDGTHAESHRCSFSKSEIAAPALRNARLQLHETKRGPPRPRPRLRAAPSIGANPPI
jgi:hypothetical protein